MKKYIKYIVPSIVTFIILGVIFYVNELYPFGEHSIVKVDADFQYIPVLYKIYDLLHIGGKFFYSDIGFGNNIFISMIIQGSLFSPVNLLLYFTSRSNIVNYYNILIITKLCLISLTSFIYINKKFKVDNFYKILGSIIYTFSGFVILNFFNIMWLDCIILLPLIMLYLDKLLDEKKYLGYIITLSLSLIITYYISYFILVFIVFYSYIYIFLTIKDKKEIKEKIYYLGMATIIALLISSFSTIPSLYQTFISSRFTSTGYYTLNGNVMGKSLYILFSPLFVILSLLYITKYKHDKLTIYRFILLLVLYLLGIFIEPINLLLHGGSYWDFPYRYGFITTFILMIGSFKYLEKYDLANNKKYNIIKAILFPISIVLVVYFSDKYLAEIIKDQIVLTFDNVDIYQKIVLIILLVFVSYIIALSFSSKKLRKFSLSIICLVSLYVFCSFTMYFESGYFLTSDANKLNNDFNFPKDGRYKMDYTVYSPDYGFMFQVDTLDNWLHVIPDGEVDTYRRLGYKTTDTCIRSYGGTIFTDWLFNVKYLISNREKDSELYKLIDSKDGKYLYEYKYNIPNNGIIFNNKLDIDYTDNYFDNQNEIYKNLFNSDYTLIKTDFYEEDNLNINYKIKEKGILYLYTNDYSNIDYIKIGDRNIYDYDNYIKELGMYNEDIDIEIVLKNEINIRYTLGFIKLSDILKLNSSVEYKDNKYYVNSDSNNNYLFLPINNITGLKVYLNNKVVKTQKYYDNFMMIKLNKGNNVISIKYEMPFFKLGIILSILGIILLIIFKYIKPNNLIHNIGYYSFIILTFLMFVYFYFYSMIKYVINN